MKRQLLWIVLCVAPLYAEIKTEKTSQSFLFTKPVFTTLPARISFWHDSWFDIEKTNAFQATTQYQHSFNSKKLKRYFLMKDRDSLVVRGDTHAGTSPVTDVRAEWLGLPTNFQGTLTLAPEQWQMCTSITARRSFNFEGTTFFDNMWGFVEIPIVLMQNDMKFKQESVTNAAAATVAVRDIETAFNNTDWNYQKIKTGKQDKTKIGEVRLGFGKTFLSNGRAHVASYSAVSLPTTSKQTNEYMFTPQAGLNGHIAFIWGASFQLPLSRKTDMNDTCLFLDFENTFFLRNKQYRTFDLKNKEWSRFLLMRKKDQTTNTTTPGVNVLTQKVRVSPYAIINASGGVRFHVGSAEAEIGIGAWGHNEERIKLTSLWEENYGIAGTTTNTSASASTIKTLGADDTTFTPIKETDINFKSGASLATAVYRVHGSIGSRGRGKNNNGLFGCGFFVEIPHNNTKAFSQWGFWAKVGGAF